MSETWRAVNLEEICSVDWGNTSLTKSSYTEHGEFLAVSAAGCDGRIGHKEHKKHTPVLSAIGAQCGRMFFPEEDFTAIKNTMTLTPREGICTGRFLYQLLSYVELPKRGSAQPFISKGDIQSFQVHIPSLPEQHRIVTLLDEAFAALDAAKANAEQNLQNARALLENHLEEIFSTAREDWGEEQLGDLCEIARGGSPRPISDFITSDSNGVNWVKISDASASNKYIFKTSQKIKPEGVARSRMVHDGDFLLSNSMSFGRPYIMRTSGCIHDGWLVLSNYQDRLFQDYLYHLLGSATVYRQFDSLAAGSTVRNLNIELASRVAIPTPPLDLQQDIASEIEILSTEIQRLTQIYERKLAALEELKTSLLHQAFNGEL